jgi:hypothetical protein
LLQSDWILKEEFPMRKILAISIPLALMSTTVLASAAKPVCSAGSYVRNLPDSMALAMSGALPIQKTCQVDASNADPINTILKMNSLVEEIANDADVDAAISDSKLPADLDYSFKLQFADKISAFNAEKDNWDFCMNTSKVVDTLFNNDDIVAADSIDKDATAVITKEAPVKVKAPLKNVPSCFPKPVNKVEVLTKSPTWKEYLKLLHFENKTAKTFLQFLYQEPSGAGDAGPDGSYYSVAEHTARVLRQYEDQKNHYHVSRIQVKNPGSRKPLNIRSADFELRYTLALHDIGKSIAYRAGDKIYETYYSVPIAGVVLQNLKLKDGTSVSDDEIKVAKSLIGNHQMIGDYLRGYRTLNEVRAIIDRSIQDTGLNACAYYSLLEMVFVADASSYDSLKASVFRKAKGNSEQLVIGDYDLYSLLSASYRMYCPADLQETPEPVAPVKLKGLKDLIQMAFGN